MGFDISYHPICQDQMNKWYFSQLNNVLDGDYSKLQEVGQTAQIDPFYIEKYIDTMKVAATTQPDELFEKAHAYYLAVIQGFFLPYYYTRGTGFSFLVDKTPQMEKYTTSWKQICPNFIDCPVTDRLVENYSGGVYMAPEQVNMLLADYENDPNVHAIVSDFFEENISVFLKALGYASEHKLGLIEATEVVEPNPTDLNQTRSYSNLMNCDQDGALIYREVALKQIQEILSAQGDESSPEVVLNNASYNTRTISDPKKRKGFLGKFFKK